MKAVIIADLEQADEVNNLILEICEDPNNQVIKVLVATDVVYILNDRVIVKRKPTL